MTLESHSEALWDLILLMMNALSIVINMKGIILYTRFTGSMTSKSVLAFSP